jgi:hypothetical protein
MPSWLTMKFVSVLGAALILLLLVEERARWMHRAHVAEAQEQDDCRATRSAAGMPKLKCSEADEQIGFLGQAIAAVRAKTEAARAADQANVQRVHGEQSKINEERDDAFEKRLADARARYAAGLRGAAARGADSSGGRAAGVPSVPATAGRPDQAAGQDGLPAGDALIATEQAIQLDELIKWTKAQHAVDPNKTPQ